MRSSLLSTVVALLFVGHDALALQYSPGSPCASVCSSNSTGDAGTTTASDIVCTDENFQISQQGQTFQTCISCLQLSTTTGPDSQSDQAAFLFNMRYALATCLFSFPNTTSALVDSCSGPGDCGPLQPSLLDGDLIPSNETEYSYCSANDHALLGYSGASTCSTCLQTSGEKILANFYTALQVGCQTQPPAGTIIGLNDSVVSLNAITQTSPGQNYETPPAESKGLSVAQIVGIAVGLSILFMVSAITVIVVWMRRRSFERMRNLGSPLNRRYGAKEISAPTEGAYGSPPPFTPFHDASPRYVADSYFELSTTKDGPGQFPTHQAYIPHNTLRNASISSITPLQPVLSPSTSRITYWGGESQRGFTDEGQLLSSAKSRPPPITIPSNFSSRSNPSVTIFNAEGRPDSGSTFQSSRVQSQEGSLGAKRFSPGREGIGSAMSVTAASEAAHEAGRQRERQREMMERELRERGNPRRGISILSRRRDAGQHSPTTTEISEGGLFD